MLLALTVGLASLLSYSLNASDALRSDSPAFAAWWETHQFYFMEGGATALGLLLGIRLAGSFTAGSGQHPSAGRVALLFAIIGLAPLIHVCAAAARLGWNGRGASIASWIISREGFDNGRYIDKVVIAAVYFLKIVGFALLCGLGLMIVAYAAVIAFEVEKAETGQA
jgi:hypothetical protein